MSECDECGRESNDTMEMTVARLTNEVELSKRVVTAHRRLCDQRAARIKELTAALAEAEAIIAKLDYALNACINQDDFDNLLDKLNEQISARREKGGAK